jgi:putative ABC transport system ATP-binding protein
VAIARAVVSEPALILADEPTANVDSKTAESLLVLMEHLNHDHNSTFIFSTHDPRVMGRAHRLIMMKDGEIEEDRRVE